MSVLDGYNKYKRYIKTNDGYKLCSQWTSSNTVQMDDGNTLQTNLGAINGITDSLTATSSNIAASAAAVKTLNDSLNKYSYSALTIANTDYFKDSGCFVSKVGNQVNMQIQINVIKGYAAWSDLLVTTIPSGYRPRRGLIKTVHSNDGFSGALRIESNGTVKLQSFNGLTGNFIFENFSYSI